MASVRHLKKEVTELCAELIDVVSFWELVNKKKTEQSQEAFAQILNLYDTYLGRINQKDVAQKKAHFKQLRTDFEKELKEVVEKINALN